MKTNPRGLRTRPDPDGMYRHLYVHVPFCRRKCAYCDFASAPAPPALRKRYVDCLARELARYAGTLERCETVYIGGGTPSMLSERETRALLRAVRAVTPHPPVEFTIEANPESLTPGKLALYRASGVNRVSLGVQSFDDARLRSLGRLHDSDTAVRAVRMIRDAGFDNFSLDLIFAAPDMTLEEWERTLARMMELEPPHVSLYAFTFERGTPLSKLRAAGRVRPVGEDEELEMYRRCVALLESAGLWRYEVSNFARRGFECRHNRTYWRCVPYFGAGTAAASFTGTVRTVNVRKAENYCRRIESNRSPVSQRETLTPFQRAAEFIMLGLRERRGITVTGFGKVADTEMSELLLAAAARMKRLGLLSFNGRKMRLTRRGMEVADTVILELVSALE